MNTKLLAAFACLLATVAVCSAALAESARPTDDAEFFSAKRRVPLASRHDHENTEDGPLLHHSFIAPLNHYDGADQRTFIYVSDAGKEMKPFIQNRFYSTRSNLGTHVNIIFHVFVSRTQNYTCNMQYYQAGGPLFFHIHDSGVHSTRWIEGGLMYDLARELNGAMFIADHRYSGHNIPTP